MTYPGYGPPWRINGPLPSRPIYGLLQAADAPAAGVTLVTDLDVAAARGILQEAVQARDKLIATEFPSSTDLDAAINRVIDAQAALDRAANGDIERWINGAALYPYPPGPAHAWNACAIASEAVEKDDGVEVPNPEFGAMTVYLAETCTSKVIRSQEEFKSRALISLASVEGAAVAREFMAGDVLPLNPHLADGNGVFPNGDTATSPTEALALLEGQIAASGQFGVIHVSPLMATALMSRFLAADVGGVIRTRLGTVVIPDAGYGTTDPITGVYTGGATPAGHAAATGTQEWMFATGTIELRQSEMFVNPEDVSEALNRSDNSITYRAERYFLVDWDTQTQAAVKADRCLTTCS